MNFAKVKKLSVITKYMDKALLKSYDYFNLFFSTFVIYHLSLVIPTFAIYVVLTLVFLVDNLVLRGK